MHRHRRCDVMCHGSIHMSHDLGTVTIFRLLGLGFRLGKGIGLGLRLEQG
jgi:hypothetical protein